MSERMYQALLRIDKDTALVEAMVCAVDEMLLKGETQLVKDPWLMKARVLYDELMEHVKEMRAGASGVWKEACDPGGVK